MPSRAVRIGALAGALSSGLSGCLDANPKFVEPTETGGSTGSGTTGSPTTGPSTTSTTTTPPPTTGATTDTTMVTTTVGETTGGVTTSMSTGAQPACGDGMIEGLEECDDGPANADDAPCTSGCKNATCGDGLLLAGFEECDDGDADPADGCFGCIIPRTCLNLLTKADELGVPLPTDFYEIDLDGTDAIHLPMIVKCDMDTPPGGWTVVERSPRDNPIGRPLFDPPPPPFNDTMPQMAPYRMRGKDMGKLVMNSSALRLDCGGPDFLEALAIDLNAGVNVMDLPCGVFVSVEYGAAEVKGVPYSGKLCTGMFGAKHQCDGAWHVSEQGQMQQSCQGPLFPWMGQVTMGANLFAVDPKIPDTQAPVHDCHKAGAIREIKLR
jgi:cysteine-rich repeat protein